jgi:hypothetical protein
VNSTPAFSNVRNLTLSSGEKEIFTLFCQQMLLEGWGQQMAGRYQGYHRFANKDGQFEVYWDWDRTGWFWRPRCAESLPTENKAVGPFVTSTEAYQNAMNEPEPSTPSAVRSPHRSSGLHKSK